jgi:hypothetical protein
MEGINLNSDAVLVAVGVIAPGADVVDVGDGNGNNGGVGDGAGAGDVGLDNSPVGIGDGLGDGAVVAAILALLLLLVLLRSGTLMGSITQRLDS